MADAEQGAKKDSLLAQIRRKTANAGHVTRLGAYKTKKNAQIQALKFKVTERKKQFGLDYMNLVEDDADREELRVCMTTAFDDLAELRKQIEKHSNKKVMKEELVQEKIDAGPPEPSESDAKNEAPEEARQSASNRKPTTTRRDAAASAPPAHKPNARRAQGQSPATSTAEDGPERINPYRQPQSPTKTGVRLVNPPNPPKGANTVSPVKKKPEAKTSNLRGKQNSALANKWKLCETTFSGAASYEKIGKQEVVKGKSISVAIKKFKQSPELYTALYYQTDMIDWEPDRHQYTLIHSDGTEGYTPKGTGKNGWMTLLTHKYERLPPLKNNALPKDHRDAYTDSMTFNRKKLHSKSNKPILPGRGMGVGDIPELKIIGDVDPSDIYQGSVGDCWLLSGISALAEFDGAIKRLFRKTKGLDEMPRDNGPNIYTITLWDLTTWKEVDIKVDERLCAAPGGGLLASRPSEDGELWVCYIEKAVAAHCGGWDKLVGGQCTHAWSLLIGCKEQYMISKSAETGKYCCYGKYNTHEKRWAKHGNSPHDGERGMWRVPWPKVGGGGSETLELTEDEMFLRLVAWDRVNYVVGAGTKGDSDKAKTDGLVDNHAYSVIESHDNVAGTGIGLLKVRNPWGKGEIEDGEFDDDGPGWDRYPQIKRALKPVVADDGIFWVTKKEFFHYYETIYLSASDMTEFLED